ncbi:MAG: methylmalonyl Co-A mutase-associated GTPase MeaB [Patulibacter sp.]
MSATPPPPPATAFEELLAGDQAVLSRALSLLQRADAAADLLAARLRPYAGTSLVVGFTGPPGAGKSSLIASYLSALRRDGRRAAVLAVDPSSPISGGSLLGDRVRMGALTSDPGIFIRSVASGGHVGGLALCIPRMIDALDAAGWPVVVLETVGVGQAESEVVDIADVKVVLTAPGLGDEIQALKAGMLELADVLVVNKSDLPRADLTRRQLEAMLPLRPAHRPVPPVISTSTTVGDGVDDLVAAIDGFATGPDARPPQRRAADRLRHALVASALSEFRDRLSALPDEHVDELAEAVAESALDWTSATEQLVERAAGTRS